MKRELQEALGALARAEGKTEDELLTELLKGRFQGAPAPRTEIVPRQSRAVARSPEERQSDAQAMERWLEAEQAPTGVFGAGGMTAGGIFGEIPVATEGFDAPAYGRAIAELAHLQRYPAPQPYPAYPQHAPYPPPQQLPAPAPTVRFMRYEGPTVTVFEGPFDPRMLPGRR